MFKKWRFNLRFNRAVKKVYKRKDFWKLWSMKAMKSMNIKETWNLKLQNKIGSLDQESKKVVMDIMDLLVVEGLKNINYMREFDTIERRSEVLTYLKIRTYIHRMFTKVKKSQKKVKEGKLRGVSRKR